VGTITSANDGHKEPVTSLESIKVKGEDFVVSGGADSMLKVWNLMGGIVFSESQGSVITSLKSSQDSFGET
jgi:WD40 repeat protein